MSPPNIQKRYDSLRRDVERMGSAFALIKLALDHGDAGVVADVAAIFEQYVCGVLDQHQDAERGVQ